MGILKNRPAPGELNLGPLQSGLVGEFQPRNLTIFVGNEGVPVKTRPRHGPPETRRVFKIVGETRSVDQELFRHAAADHASTSNAVLFRNHHARAIAGSDASGAYAARSGADDEEV